MQGGVDNWGLVQRLTASVTGAACFGNAVDVWGDVIAVAAYLDDSAGNSSGKAFVFQRMQGGVDNWAEVAELASDTPEENDGFGQSLAVWGDVIVVGATGGSGAAGEAHVFQRLEGGVDAWGLTQTLGASDAEADDSFGVYVAISGDVLVVAAHREDEVAEDSGAVYVYLSMPINNIFMPMIIR
jgi:hypothetical protein